MLCAALAPEEGRQVQVHNSFPVPPGQLVSSPAKCLNAINSLHVSLTRMRHRSDFLTRGTLSESLFTATPQEHYEPAGEHTPLDKAAPEQAAQRPSREDPTLTASNSGSDIPKRESGQTGLGGESKFTHWSRHSGHKGVWNFIYLCI